MHPCPLIQRSELALIPSGPAGIAATLDRMVDLVRGPLGRKSLAIRKIALRVTRPLESKGYTAEAEALWRWVRNHIRYVRDIRGVETLTAPELLLSDGAGDCDDQAMLLASLLESIGHKARFKAMGFARGHFSHVLAETMIGDRWVPLETTVDRPFGWVPPGQVERMVRHV